jgi:hypothetical protein
MNCERCQNEVVNKFGYYCSKCRVEYNEQYQLYCLGTDILWDTVLNKTFLFFNEISIEIDFLPLDISIERIQKLLLLK